MLLILMLKMTRNATTQIQHKTKNETRDNRKFES